MTEIRHFAGWLRGRLRTFAGLAAVAGALALSACGGGSGAPNNFFDAFMSVSPPSATAYSGVPTSLTIDGGAGPFQAASSDSGALAVSVSGRTVVLLANNVTADTAVNVTIKDLGPLINQTEIIVPVTVRASALGNSLTIIPLSGDCGTAVCSGQTALATVKVLSAQGSPLGRAVRFDVIGSSYAIVTNNPAQPLASSLTVLTDSTGTASVILQVNAGAPTQFAQLRVTDVASGQQLTGSFTIQQNTNGSTVLTVVPDTVTIKGPFKGECNSGFVTEYFIFGGTPPYRVSSTFPGAVSLSNSTVNTNGGSFRATTNGTCVNPLLFSIVDATGLQTTAELNNVEGENERAPTAPALSVTPQVIPTGAGNCDSLNAVILVTGGTAPYNIVQTSASVPGVPPVLLGSAGTTALVFPASPDTAVDYVFAVQDSSTPKKTANFTYNCN